MATSSFKILPKNYLSDWGEFESWALGSPSAPDGWLMATGPIVSQETTNIKFGLSSALVIGSGALGGIYRTIPDGSDYQGRTFKFGVWAKSASTGPYIELNDGVTARTVHSDGSNAFVFLTTPALKLDYAATQIRINLMASANATAYFDGAVLCEGEDLFTSFEAISEWQPTLNMKQDQYEPPLLDGSLIPDNRLQSRTIRLKGTVAGTDVISARSSFDSLMKSLLSWKSDEKRNLFLYDDRYLEVFMKGFDWSYLNNLMYIGYNAQFVAPRSTTQSIGKIRKRSVISGTVTEFNLTYNGNADTRPLVSFIADQGSAITTCQLENLTTQENIIYSGTVPTSLTLNIDCDSGSVLNNSVNKVSDFGTSDFMKLIRGTNYFRFSGSNCTILIDYFERYL